MTSAEAVDGDVFARTEIVAAESRNTCYGSAACTDRFLRVGTVFRARDWLPLRMTGAGVVDGDVFARTDMVAAGSRDTF